MATFHKCDVCQLTVNTRDSFGLQLLTREVATETISEVCDPCLEDLNKKLDEINQHQLKCKKSMMQRYVTRMRELSLKNIQREDFPHD